MQQVFQIPNDGNREWLLFMAQLPAEPSSARVSMWRRLKSVGAANLLTGTWVLPASEAHATLLMELAETVRGQGGSVAMFSAHQVEGATSEDVVARFRADRAREFDEFATRADGLLAEITKETTAAKFTFAELEEIEDDLEKLTQWLGKIKARDFFPDERRNQTMALLVQCRDATVAFAQNVYDHEGATKDSSD